MPARPRFLSSRREAPPPVARGAVRKHLRMRTGARGGREGEMEKREGGAGPARSLSSARPRTRAAALGGSRRTSALVPLSLSSVHSRCRLTRAAAARGCPSFPTGRLVPFRFSRGWCASVPPSGEGERPASASRRGSRTEPAPCEACLVAAAFPPFRVSAPDPCPGT